MTCYQQVKILSHTNVCIARRDSPCDKILS